MKPVGNQLQNQNLQALSIYTTYCSTSELPSSLSESQKLALLSLGDYFNNPAFMSALIKVQIIPEITLKTVIAYLSECMAKMNITREVYQNWLGLFTFCLDFTANNLHSLYFEPEMNQRLISLLFSKNPTPLLTETIIEKASKLFLTSKEPQQGT